ncbi:MAG: hypothetical protein WCJ95_17065 [Mariniphaga sp.]
MKYLIDISDKEVYKEIEISEMGLSNLIFHDWKFFFPDYELLFKEYSLKGQVRSALKSGRIDFLGYNNVKKCLSIFEIKKDYDKNIRSQISDYEDFFEENLADIYLQIKSLQRIEEFKSLKSKKIELVLLAKSFKEIDTKRLDRLDNIVLIKHSAFDKFKFTFEIYDNRKTKNNESKQKNLSKIISVINGNPDIFKILTYFIKNEILIKEYDYKIKGSDLLLRLSQFYEQYSKYMGEQRKEFVDFMEFRNQVMNSIYCKGTIKSVRFKSSVFQVFIFSTYELDLLPK